MSAIGKIEKKAGSKFLSFYEMEAVHRDGSSSPYYMASRNDDGSSLTAVTHTVRRNHLFPAGGQGGAGAAIPVSPGRICL